MTEIAYLDCIGGLAGDMLLAALMDAGAPVDALLEVPAALGLPKVAIQVGTSSRHGIRATTVDIASHSDHDAPPGRPAHVLRQMIADSTLPPEVRRRSLNVIDRIAVVEAGIHSARADQVILHELGGVDTLIDVCGAFMLLEALEIERVVCSPVPYGRGLVTTAHGRLPMPGPAVLELLRGAPVVGVASGDEMVTPTGAALAAEITTAWGLLPAMTLGRVGYGAGHRDPPDRPNLLRVVTGSAPEAIQKGPADVLLIEANLDDLVPELIPDAIERCWAAGALDVWTVPAQMKKGRPGVVLSTLARAEAERDVVSALFEHTSTLGVRVFSARRHELDRTLTEVQVAGYAVRVKIGLLDGRVVNVAPEHDDCASVASLTGRPVKQIWAAALAAAQPMVIPAEEGSVHEPPG